MALAPLTLQQLDLIRRPARGHLFLEGPAGTGKTTVGVERLLSLMDSGIPGDSILVQLPQRTLAAPYQDALQAPGAIAGGAVTILTVGGLARRMIDLYWPLIAASAGFAQPDQPPIFLTLETAQYYMARLVRPLLDEGYFDSVNIERNRLYSQVIDNLNKAAVVGFSHLEIGDRLISAWSGEPGQARVYQDAQFCASAFREYCLAHNLLDFSLQVEIFHNIVWRLPLCRDYLFASFRHLIADNLEEDTPVAHDLLSEWLPQFDSALLICDTDAGYRRFLGADPQGAYRLRDLCQEVVTLEQSLVSSPAVQALTLHLEAHLLRQKPPRLSEDPRPALEFSNIHFYPPMLDWLADKINALVQDGLSPGEIVVLAPFVSDALRFSIMNRLERSGIPTRSHRPSRSLRDEPATQCLLTLAALAHPEWGILPSEFDVAYALVQSITELDLVRGQLLQKSVYRTQDGLPSLAPFDQVAPETQKRITYSLGLRYEHLRRWLEQYGSGRRSELDHFFSLLFGEVLSQPGYGFHSNFDASRVTASLVESVQKFRWVTASALQEDHIPLGKEYLLMVQDGVIAAQYLQSWQPPQDDAVLITPAYTFLIGNFPMHTQFWLDIGSYSWAERVYQPLTNPYILSRSWPSGKTWDASDETQTSQEALFRLVQGLMRRCRGQLYLGLSELSEQGYEQRGPLLRVFHRLLQSFSGEVPQ